MTFYEAALEVLRRNERPLHFKKITEISIREKLLSHVGRDPANVMLDRLNKELQKGERSSILESRRNVFDLKTEIRQKLNLEAQKKAESLQINDNTSYSNSQDSQRRSKKHLTNTKDENSEGLSEHELFPFDPTLLKKLTKTRFDSIEDAAHAVLKISQATPIHIQQLADILFNQKLVRFHTHEPETTLVSALITSNQVALKRGQLPIFQSYSNNRWGLSEWGFSDTSLDAQTKLEKLALTINLETQKQLSDSLINLKPEAFEMLLMTLLNLLDYSNIRVSKRSTSADVLFTADWTRGFSITRVCILVIGNKNSEADATTVLDLQESISHYNGEEGIVLHLGTFSQSIINAAKNSAKKITLLNSQSLVPLLVKHGIGVRAFNQPLFLIDKQFFDNLNR